MSVFQGTVQLRHGTRAQWSAANPILLLGEAGVETDTGRAKYGDGIRAWNLLTYAAQESGNIDGGNARSVYGLQQVMDGGGA